jgi:MoxR-like ATPase
MKFLSLFHNQKSIAFGNVQGYDDVKEIIKRALDTSENYNLLLIGPPASSKTLFLLGILDIRKDAVFFDGSNTTNRILDVLEEKRPKIILLDEIDKMSRTFQNQLLGFMETGRVDVEQQRKQYHFQISGAKVFATCNEINRLSKPLQSRFRKLFLPKYSEQQFLDISEKVLPKLSSGLARYIGAAVWKQQGDIRDVISIGKLVKKSDGPDQITEIMNTIMKYGSEGKEQ